MQYNAHKTGRAPVGLNVVCMCCFVHIKRGGLQSVRTLFAFAYTKGERSFRHVQCPFHFCAIFNNFAHELEGQMPFNLASDALTMYNVFYVRLGSTSIGHARMR